VSDVIERASPTRNVVKSADRALDVIEYVTSVGAAPTFTQIARALNVPKSSLSQLLSNLVARRYLDLDPTTATYRPGEGLLALVRSASAVIPLRALVMPIIERLRDELNETAGYYVRHGDEVELIGSAGSRHALVYIMNAGERAPLYAISPGKVILAHMTEGEFDAWLGRTPLRGYTDTTITSSDALRRDMGAIRRNGFAYSAAEYARGIQGIACAVMLGERCVGSVNVSIPQIRFDDRLLVAAQTALSIAAADLARILASREASMQGDLS
jgi:DNA-binding IclR family transcriptional regulator